MRAENPNWGKPWVRLRLHGPCLIFDYHPTEEAARTRIGEDAERFGPIVYKIQTVGYIPDLAM